jgi:hypothetical protein
MSSPVENVIPASKRSMPLSIPSHVVSHDDPAIMSFSPSKMSTETIDTFMAQNKIGVPLQTPWTFW